MEVLQFPSSEVKLQTMKKQLDGKYAELNALYQETLALEADLWAIEEKYQEELEKHFRLTGVLTDEDRDYSYLGGIHV